MWSNGTGDTYLISTTNLIIFTEKHTADVTLEFRSIVDYLTITFCTRIPISLWSICLFDLQKTHPLNDVQELYNMCLKKNSYRVLKVISKKKKWKYILAWYNSLNVCKQATGWFFVFLFLFNLEMYSIGKHFGIIQFSLHGRFFTIVQID